MGDRYFPATAIGGRLYLDGQEEACCDEAVVEMLVACAGHWKARTEAELLEAVGESERGLAAIRVWVHEGIKEATKRLRREQNETTRLISGALALEAPLLKDDGQQVLHQVVPIVPAALVAMGVLLGVYVPQNERNNG